MKATITVVVMATLAITMAMPPGAPPQTSEPGHWSTRFITPMLAEYLLAGIQYALRDLDADATPSAKLAGVGRK